MSKQEQKHTPGPWEAAGQKVFASGLPCSNHVATAYAVGGHGLYANARLIAAAPELLEALESAATTAHYRDERNFCHGSFDECSNIACRGWRELIAKAKGGAS